MVAILSANDTSLITANTPQCLRDRSQWVVWRYEERKGKRTKVPYDAKTGRMAKSTDPATWTTFEQAAEAYGGRDGYHGVGFVFAKDDPYCGIDLDDCRRADGTLAPWAQEIVDQFPSYTEISPSNKGVKVFLVGKKPDFARSAVKNVDPDGGPGEMEIYQDGRYFTVTGNILPGSPADVTDCQQQLDTLCGRFWSPTQQSPVPTSQASLAQTQPSEISSHRDDRVGRCLAEMLKMKVADQNDGSHRLFAAACRCVEHDLSDSEAQLCIWTYGKLRPFPKPWMHPDVLKRIRDAEEHVTRGEALAGDGDIITPAYRNVEDIMMETTGLHRPVISGILREGETMNIIAAPKTGKSWLATDLALAVATGRPWLGLYETTRGNVLILDNELHVETSANRIPKVAAARCLDVSQYGQAVFVENLRGKLVDLLKMESYFAAIEPDVFKVVILDAWYRFIPAKTDENDNGTITQLYNAIDKYADRLKCSFVLIHHASKGNQSAKAVTDVGSGAGAQSRATDTHLVLRPHEQEGVVVLDAAVRSWQPPSPMCLRWDFPVFNPALDLDPTMLRPERQRRSTARKEVEPPAPKAPQWDAEMFVSSFLSGEGRQMDTIINTAVGKGLSQAAAKRLLSQAEDAGKVFRWRYGGNKPVKFATVTQPLIDSGRAAR
jgi:hypothetical protein